MSERITEADLEMVLRPEGDVCPDCLAPDDCGEPDSDECRHLPECMRARLVAELRRLRRLIADLGTFRADQSHRVAAFAQLYGIDYTERLHALETEARAIREEQGLT